MFVGETLEELARNMGVPEETFLATVERYNALCHKGHDDDFYKLPNYLKPLQNSPFFAIRSHMATDGVFGGLDADRERQCAQPRCACRGTLLRRRHHWKPLHQSGR